MGLRYLGPIDGHNLPLLISSLEYAKASELPVVLHVLTKKGKGYEAALNHPEKFHGLGPYDPVTGNTPAGPNRARRPNYQEVFGQTMVKLCQKDNSIVGITAAMPSGTGLKALEKAMPAAITTWASPRNTPFCLPPAWPRWASIPSAPSTRLSCSGPTIASCMTWPCRICR